MEVENNYILWKINAEEGQVAITENTLENQKTIKI